MIIIANTAASLVPTKKMELFVWRPAKEKRTPANYATIICRQVDGKPEEPERTLLHSAQPTGWDWLPENLIYEQANGNVPLTRWLISTSHRYNEVIAYLENLGFTVKTLELLPEQYAFLFPERKPQPQKTSAYQRLRWLWKNHSDKLTTWEKEFVRSIGSKQKVNAHLSTAQSAALEKLFSKYKVPDDAYSSYKT